MDNLIVNYPLQHAKRLVTQFHSSCIKSPRVIIGPCERTTFQGFLLVSVFWSMDKKIFFFYPRKFVHAKSQPNKSIATYYLYLYQNYSFYLTLNWYIFAGIDILQINIFGSSRFVVATTVNSSLQLTHYSPVMLFDNTVLLFGNTGLWWVNLVLEYFIQVFINLEFILSYLFSLLIFSQRCLYQLRMQWCGG